MTALSLYRTVALCACFTLQAASAAKSGDEAFQQNATGYFYVFASKAIHIIDPQSLSVKKTITRDQDGKPLTNNGAQGSKNSSRIWNDAVYLQDPTRNLYYIFANEADIYGTDASNYYSYVSVIDTQKQAIIARVKVGPRPVHGYAVSQLGQFWTHPDALGDFDVISITNATSLNRTNIHDFVNKAGHGKLLVEDALFPTAYGTNVNEQTVFKFDLKRQERIGAFAFRSSLPSPDACTGLHSISYLNTSRHLMAECVSGGVLEWNTANDSYVAYHADVQGGVTSAPGDDYIINYDTDNNMARVLQPQGNGVPSKVLYTVNVPGSPTTPAFYTPVKTSDNDAALGDTMVYMPLTATTNVNNIRGAKARGSSVDAPGYSSKPTDCAYDTAVSASSTSSGGDAPGLRLAKNSTGLASTPGCGACAPGFSPVVPSQFQPTLSGFRLLNLTALAAAGPSVNTTAPLLSAGAVLVGKDEGDGVNECAFEEASRSAKRGGGFVATTVDLPSPSLAVVDGSTGSLVGFVPTAADPSTIVWAPIPSS